MYFKLQAENISIKNSIILMKKKKILPNFIEYYQIE